MKNIVSLILLFCLGPILCFGQSFEGEIIDADDGEVISFTNVMFQKSNKGTTSNEKGRFTIRVNEADLKDTLLFSHIGYATKKIAIVDLDDVFNQIKVEFLGYDLPTATISDISAFEFVKKALKSISNNYPQERSILKGFYNEEVVHSDGTIFSYGEGFLETMKNEYVDNPNNKDSYLYTSDGRTKLIDGFFEVFHEYFILINDEYHSFPSITEGGNIPRVLDILKSPMSFLLRSNLKKYDWEFSGVTFNDGKTASVISFKPIKETTNSQGEIVIDDENLAILAARFSFTDYFLKQYSSHNTMVNLLSRNFEVEYKKTGEFYSLQKVNARSTFQHKFSGEIFYNKINFTTTDREFRTNKEIYPDEMILAHESMSNYALGSTDLWTNSDVIQRSEKIQKALEKGHARGSIPKSYVKRLKKDGLVWVKDTARVYDKIANKNITIEQLELMPALEWNEVRRHLLNLVIETDSVSMLERVDKVLTNYKDLSIYYEWLDLKGLILFRKGKVDEARAGIKEINRLALNDGVNYSSFLDILELNSRKTEFIGHTFQGKIIDADKEEPIPFANVFLDKSNIGTMSNEKGLFTILVEKTELSDSILFSHIGYTDKKLAVADMDVSFDTIRLKKLAHNQPVQAINEKSDINIIKKALKSVEMNFPQENHLLSGFYNEQMQHADGRVFDYSEGVLQILKEKYWNSPTENLVFYGATDEGTRIITGFYEVFYKYMVMESENLYTMPGIMAGGSSPQIIDLLKNVESFLLKTNLKRYEWKFTGMTYHGNRLAKVISFEPKNKKALFRGEIFIDNENNAILYSKYEVADQMLSEMNEDDYWVDVLSKDYEVEYRRSNNLYILGSVKIKTQYKQKFSGEVFNYSMNYVTTDCLFNSKNEITYTDRMANVQRLLPFNGRASHYGKDINVIQRTDEVQNALVQSMINKEKNIDPVIVYAGMDNLGAIVDYDRIVLEEIGDYTKTLEELETSENKVWRKIRGVLLALILEARDSTDLERLGQVLIENRETAIYHEWLDLRALILYKQGNKQKAFIEQQDILTEATKLGIFYRSTLHIYKDMI